MSDTLTLSAEAREQVGKGASRSLRREGRVPAVIYGNKQDPKSIHVSERELTKLLMTGHFFNSVVMIGGERTLPKDVAFDPVSDRPVHADFLRISEHATVHVNVPIVFTDEEAAPGIKRGGGTAGHNGLRSTDKHIGPDFRRVRIGIGHPGHKDRVHGYVLGNYAKSEIEPLTDMLGAIAAEAPWLAAGDDARFMSDVALRLQD